MPTGVVRNRFDNEGFGFIIPDQGSVAVFVHRRALENVQYRTASDAVTFTYAWNALKNGWMAIA